MGEDAFQQDDWEARLDFCTAECFCLVRFAELFDIIADYPDSHSCRGGIANGFGNHKHANAIGRNVASILENEMYSSWSKHVANYRSVH